MATMTYSNALLPLAGIDKTESHEALKAAPAAKPGFFARLLAAMIESRRRSAAREIARMEVIYGHRIRTAEGKAALESFSAGDLPFNSKE